jgi:hypothetical protein
VSFKTLVQLGRNLKAFSGSKQGAIIQLEGDVAYLTNSKRSVVYVIKLKQHLGTGTFYAGEAPIISEKVERREGKVLFEWRDSVGIRRKLGPDRAPFKELADTALKKFFVEPDIEVPVSLFEAIDPSIIITQLSVSGDVLTVRQTRSDGSVMLESLIKLSQGLKKVNHPPTGFVAFFTDDLYALKGIVKNMAMKIEQGKPISLRANTVLGDLIGVIAHLTYER